MEGMLFFMFTRTVHPLPKACYKVPHQVMLKWWLHLLFFYLGLCSQTCMTHSVGAMRRPLLGWSAIAITCTCRSANQTLSSYKKITASTLVKNHFYWTLGRGYPFDLWHIFCTQVASWRLTVHLEAIADTLCGRLGGENGSSLRACSHLCEMRRWT